jgi:hypothetical protein
MELEEVIGYALRIGVLTSTLLMLAGLVLIVVKPPAPHILEQLSTPHSPINTSSTPRRRSSRESPRSTPGVLHRQQKTLLLPRRHDSQPPLEIFSAHSMYCNAYCMRPSGSARRGVDRTAVFPRDTKPRNLLEGIVKWVILPSLCRNVQR